MSFTYRPGYSYSYSSTGHTVMYWDTTKEKVLIDWPTAIGKWLDNEPLSLWTKILVGIGITITGIGSLLLVLLL